ncbi:ubiquitin carboxyl-terminal hydrolase 12-like [Brachyhypopomus gauderio]|uniref:ubiquitin carboxyl-terminal hydrolase 12-like n=1 Tax=Brachyhypopomus gauderio TaxID=698409 RepID=UPI004041A427
MGCVYSCMKKNKKAGVENEVVVKKEKKKRKWWRFIKVSSKASHGRVSSEGHSMDVTSSTSSSEGHNSPAPTSPPVISFQNTLSAHPAHSWPSAPRSVAGQVETAASVQTEACVHTQNVLQPHIPEMKPESGQGEGEGHAPTVSTVRDTDIQQLGFPNIGNTCYMNATLQCLLSLSSFWRPIRAQCFSWTDPFSCQMLRCFADLQQGRLTTQSSTEKMQLLGALNACVSVWCPEFGEDYEQDAHEFLLLCFRLLKEEGEILTDSFSHVCPVASFEFYIKTMRTCSSCGLQNTRMEDFNHLSVDLSSTLTDSLHSYFKPTVLEYYCECGQGSEAHEEIEFFSLPQVLILHVKRFNMLGQKLRDRMDIPAELDLSVLPGASALMQQLSGPACTLDKPHESPENVQKNSLPEQEVNESREGLVGNRQHFRPLECFSTYRLNAVVSHLGVRMDSGHYISHVAEEGESWLSFNDSKVTRKNEAAILKSAATTAYLLFYVQSVAGERNVAPWKEDLGEAAVSP